MRKDNGQRRSQKEVEKWEDYGQEKKKKNEKRIKHESA